MKGFAWQTIRNCSLALLTVATTAGMIYAQQPGDGAPAIVPADTRSMLKAIDQLTAQNDLLEKQNQQLMEQIKTLRQTLAGQATQSSQTLTSPVLASGSSSSAVPAAETRTENTVSMQTPSQAKPSSQGTSAAQNSSPDQQSSLTQTTGTKTSGNPTGNVDEGYQEPLMWGEWNPGKGFKVASGERGELNLSGYMAARYLNQLPANQTAVDHLGRPVSVQARQDFQFHRVMLYTSGWFLDPKFTYFTFVWTVNDTTQVAVGGALSYNFNKKFQLGLGINGLPVTRSIQGNHPYWLSYDRVMADEFFRPFFTQGLFGGGEIAHRLYYKWMTGNNLSTLGVRATQLTRELNFGASLTWMPTTGEFGPRGGFGDFEDHQKLATRFGMGYGVSRENRQSNENDPTNNTTIRLADSLNIFDTGALADGVTVTKTTWHLVAADAGIKKHGFWIGGEGYYRLLDNFDATGPLPVGSIRDTGFYVQASDMVVPKKFEVYAGTSYVFSNYGKPKEFLYGANWYPAKDRNYRVNLHIINVDHSPVSSTFGFYMGQLKGPVVAVGVTALY